IQKSAGTLSSNISLAFTDMGGTFQVDSGTVALSTGKGAFAGTTFNVAAGATVDLSGNTSANVFSGVITGTGTGSLLLQNGAMVIGAAGATFDFAPGQFQWTGGGINLDGHTLTNVGEITLANAANNNIFLFANGFFDAS